MSFASTKRRLGGVDWILIFATLCIASFGLVILASAGYDTELGYSPEMRKQAFSLMLGIVGAVVCALIQVRLWKNLAWPLYLLGCVLLVAILFTGVVAGGARRWLDLGGFRMQPSEMMKIGVILAVSRLVTSDRAPKSGYSFTTLLIPGVLMLVPAVLTLVEPDLGTAVCQLLIGGSIVFLAGVQRKTILTLALIGAVLAPVAWKFMLKDYQRQRVLTFLEPEQDPLGSGYHAMQSKIAVGSGALTGKGFREGTQTQLRFLPEQTTDFIFSVLAEEWGFFGSISILILYSIVILRLITIASQLNDPFAVYVTFGVAAMIFWHVLVNIGMVCGVMPVVGITLIMLSYGGSSLVTVLAGIGIVLGINARRYKFSS